MRCPAGLPVDSYALLVYHCGPHPRAAPLGALLPFSVLRERLHPPLCRLSVAKSAAP
jgi:hypothetical protein